MFETNEKINQLNYLIEKRNLLLNDLKEKEDIPNLTQNNDENLAKDFEELLNECKLCDEKIKQYKVELPASCFIKFEENFENTKETGLIVKKENKIINWFKNKINEFRYNYEVERAIGRDRFQEENITAQIDSFNAYLNVIKSNGTKAIFKKSLNKIKTINNKNFNHNKI